MGAIFGTCCQLPKAGQGRAPPMSACCVSALLCVCVALWLCAPPVGKSSHGVCQPLGGLAMGWASHVLGQPQGGLAMGRASHRAQQWCWLAMGWAGHEVGWPRGGQEQVGVPHVQVPMGYLSVQVCNLCSRLCCRQALWPPLQPPLLPAASAAGTLWCRLCCHPS